MRGCPASPSCFLAPSCPCGVTATGVGRVGRRPPTLTLLAPFRPFSYRPPRGRLVVTQRPCSAGSGYILVFEAGSVSPGRNRLQPPPARPGRRPP